MFDASDSQNRSGDDDPFVIGGDSIDVESFESATESDPVFMPAVQDVYPSGRSEGMGESSA